MERIALCLTKTIRDKSMCRYDGGDAGHVKAYLTHWTTAAVYANTNG